MRSELPTFNFASLFRRSLLGDLFVRVFVLLGLIVIVIGLLAFVTARKQIDRVYDEQLIVGANVLEALMQDELQETRELSSVPGAKLEINDDLLSPEDREAFNSYAQWRLFRIWRGQRLVIASDTGPALSAPAGAYGFTNVVEGARRWRIYTLGVPNSDVVVQVGERPGVRGQLVQQIALDLILPLLLLIPLGGALIWISLTDGLRQMRALFTQLGARGADLSPVRIESTSEDVAALVNAINELLARVETAMSHERSFVEHAAHQLRTPLAALRLEAQMLAREQDPQALREHSERLREGVDRAANLVEQLLTLARLEAQTEAAPPETLRNTVTEAIAAVAPLASAREVELHFDSHGSDARGDPTLLRLIAANLIENAVKHAPPNTAVTISIRDCREGGQILSVADCGPGLNDQDRTRVFDRFYRVSGDRTSGAGLGLSIVSEAVRRLNGAIALEPRGNRQPGLEASVRLPLNPV